MRFKLVENFTLTEGSGLSRIWQYTHNNQNFAIIGTQDKDTKEDRTNELTSLLRNMMDSQVRTKKPVGKPMITYKKLEGHYIYDDGTQGTENSFLINNITKEEALELGRAVNQESILWKDDNFFGYIYCSDGHPDMTFSRDDKNMGFNKDDVYAFGSRLKSKHNEGQGFTFVAEHYVYDNSKKSRKKEVLFKLRAE